LSKASSSSKRYELDSKQHPYLGYQEFRAILVVSFATYGKREELLLD